MKVTVTNEERAALAAWMLRARWGGSEEQLSTLYDAFEALGIDEYRPYVQADGSGALPAEMVSDTAREVVLTEEGLAALLADFPASPTPAPLGPAKVRLLRKLRALVPRKLEAVK